MMRLLIVLLSVLILMLQYKLILGPGGVKDAAKARTRVEKQQARNGALKTKNSILIADIKALKKDSGVVENRARSSLGMVKQGEVFYQVVTKDKN